jgi:hypothetical protein
MGSSHITGLETIIFADNASFDGTERAGALSLNGELWIGSTAAPHVVKNTLTQGAGISISNGAGSITIANTGVLTAATLTGNDGLHLSPVSNNFNIVTANSIPTFAGVALTATLTLDFNKTNLILGTNPVGTITTASLNVGVGQFCLGALTTGQLNTCVGNNAGTLMDTGGGNTCLGYFSGAVMTGGSNNTFVGGVSGAAATSTTQNSIVGYGAYAAGTTGGASFGRNCALGYTALNKITTGNYNIGIGISAGTNYTGAESGNIILGFETGTLGESQVMRLGNTSSPVTLTTYLTGDLRTSSGRVVKTTVPGAYPYTTLTTDYVILVDTGAARTINLIATPDTGRTYRIKDNVGTGAAFNITITPAAGTIDGAASYVVNTNWGSVDVVYQGTSWRVL